MKIRQAAFHRMEAVCARLESPGISGGVLTDGPGRWQDFAGRAWKYFGY